MKSSIYSFEVCFNEMVPSVFLVPRATSYIFSSHVISTDTCPLIVERDYYTTQSLQMQIKELDEALTSSSSGRRLKIIEICFIINISLQVLHHLMQRQSNG